MLGRLDEFEFSGRVGVSYADDGFNGKLRWQQSGGAYDARLSGPLGVGTVLISGDGNEAAITDKDGVTTVLPDVEAALYERYGWTIPVDSLRYWALGIPDPRVAAETRVRGRWSAHRTPPAWLDRCGRPLSGRRRRTADAGTAYRPRSQDARAPRHRPLDLSRTAAP